MKKIGLLGGMAWPSTVDYYRAICQGASAFHRARGAAEPVPVPWITIESVNMAETRALRGVRGGEASWSAFDAVLRGVLERLEAAGCEVAAMASNTPHARLHAIREAVSIPIISILDESAKAAAGAGARKALVLGTSVTMEGTHYAEALAARGVEAVGSFSPEEIAAMQVLIDAEYHDGATAKGRAELLKVCARHAGDREQTVILLACTELPLAFPDHADDPVFEAEGFRFVNTAAAHVRGILEHALDGI